MIFAYYNGLVSFAAWKLLREGGCLNFNGYVKMLIFIIKKKKTSTQNLHLKAEEKICLLQ